MLFFGQMATKALLTPEQYLAKRFERAPEFVHGEIAERTLPNLSHGRTQQRLAVRLDGAGYCCTDVRMRLAEDLFRIPDVALFEGTGPAEEIPSSPPLLVVEVSSPDDRLHDLLRKLEDYRIWGVRNIWLVEPELKKLHVYDNGSLKEVSRFELDQTGLAITATELFG
jgi:Uma2 family endonuclease